MDNLSTKQQIVLLITAIMLFAINAIAVLHIASRQDLRGSIQGVYDERFQLNTRSTQSPISFSENE